MNNCIINLEEAPVWDFFVTIRGMTIPMTSPLDCPDMPDAPIPSQGEIDQMTKRWPGLFVWLWRGIVGGPRVRRGDLPDDGGAEYVRDVCQVILGDEHCVLVGEMSTGECAQVIQSYKSCQNQWIQATHSWAGRTAGKKFDRSSSTPSATSAGQPMTRVAPGGRVPMSLNPQRHPSLVQDEDEGDKAE
ncbi:hypothetical protein COB72_03470 [bacterium]|nr:MAG: hypothetical protein COB72_03470 [bacterium]